MKNLFIPYKLTVIAKEKGFNEPCLCIWEKKNIYSVQMPSYASGLLFKSIINSEVGNKTYTAPLYQQIVDWFREKHKIKIVENPNTGGWDIYNYDGFEYHLRRQLGDINEAIEEAFKLI